MVYRLLLLALLAAPARAQSPASAAAPDAGAAVPDTVVTWIRVHAVPLDGADPALPDGDLDALAPLLGDARVIGVGEGTHGTREFFQFRDRLVRWLARRGELDAVLWETEFVPLLQLEPSLNDPAVPIDTVTIDALDEMWATEENRALLAALRAHNAAAEAPVRFVGADVWGMADNLVTALAAAERVGGEAERAADSLVEAFGSDPRETCPSRSACLDALRERTPDQARAVAQAALWLADALEAEGEWEGTVGARAASHRVLHVLQYALLTPNDGTQTLADLQDGVRQTRAAADRAATTLGALADLDPTFWATVGPTVGAIPRGYRVYRDSLSVAGRYTWDDAARTVRARLTTGRYGPRPGLVAAADTLVQFLGLLHEGLRAPTGGADFDNEREVGIGAVVSTLARALGRGGRVVYAAHNMHVGYNASHMLARKPAGAFVRDAVGEDYLAVGTYFGRGSFQAFDQRAWQEGWDGPQRRTFMVEPAPGSFEAALMATGLDAFALDLREVPAEGPVAEWFRAAQTARIIGNSYNPNNLDFYDEEVVVPDGFDVLVFFRDVDRAVPTPAARTRSTYDLD